MEYLVEVISKQPFDKFCKDNIFTPLGMTKTSWRLADTPLKELAIPYSEPFAPTSLKNPFYTFADYPNGGVRTTVMDLSKFQRAIINDGISEGKTILKPATMKLIKAKSGVKRDIFEYGLTFNYVNFSGIELFGDRKSTRLNSSHRNTSRMPSSA